MKKLFICFCLIVLPINFYAQDLICGTPNSSSNQNFSSLYRMKNTTSLDNEKNLCLNVFFHILRDNNGNGTITAQDWSSIIGTLNTYFSTAKISFVNIGSDYINNTLLKDIESPSEFNSLLSINNKSNAINIYIIESADFFNGYANGILSKDLILTKSAASTNVSVHEMGHCINLYHTHETKFGIENATNCTYAGDLLCDTPPDSGLRINNIYYVNPSCNYTKNDGYNPDTKNIMSYTTPECMEHFTLQQKIRMRDAILASPTLQPVINCSCSENTLIGKSEICNNESSVYAIPCGNVTFSISDKLQILNQTTNSITLKPINTNTVGSAYLDYTINGVTSRKWIWIGMPNVEVSQTTDSNYVYLDLLDINPDIDKQNITNIAWEVVSVTGNATMAPAINSFSNVCKGNSTSWSMNIIIKVTNTCGTFNLYKTITPSVSSCNNYSLIENEKNQYSIYNNIIYPCLSSSNPEMSNSTSKSYNSSYILKHNEVETVTIYSINGVKVKEYQNINIFDTKKLPKGIYFVKAFIKGDIINLKLNLK